MVFNVAIKYHLELKPNSLDNKEWSLCIAQGSAIILSGRFDLKKRKENSK